SDDTIKTINAIPGNVAKAVIDTVGGHLGDTIKREVKNGFEYMDKRRRVCAMPWSIFVPLIMLLITLIVFTVVIYIRSAQWGFEAIHSLLFSCLGIYTFFMVLIAIIYCIWLCHR
ncbi:MAG: hypothetical protein LIP02_12405, partial [Bacteroidales bacterium]|nr:hypothetical protein [Bacteroidales bacterium]